MAGQFASVQFGVVVCSVVQQHQNWSGVVLYSVVRCGTTTSKLVWCGHVQCGTTGIKIGLVWYNVWYNCINVGLVWGSVVRYQPSLLYWKRPKCIIPHSVWLQHLD